MKYARLFALLFSCSALFACEQGQFGAREKGALAGGALGAGLGAIVGNQVGNSGAGIAIGSAIGALSGGVLGNEIDRTDTANQRTDSQIRAQDQQIQENRRILEALKSRGLDARITSRGVVTNLPDVLFEFGQVSLTPAARRAVQEIHEVLITDNNRLVSIEGHTDSVGTAVYNEKLSRDRALSVADALSSRGIRKSRIAVRGLGEGNPIASNDTTNGRQRNRRVEVIIEN